MILIYRYLAPLATRYQNVLDPTKHDQASDLTVVCLSEMWAGLALDCSMSDSPGLCYATPRSDATTELVPCRLKTSAVCGVRLKHSPKDLSTKSVYPLWIPALAVCVADDEMDSECLSFAMQPDNHEGFDILRRSAEAQASDRIR